MTNKEKEITYIEYQLNEESKESEDNMYFSIIIGLLSITTDFQTAYIKLNEIQAIEFTDILTKEGGIVSINLKDREESLVFRCISDKKWKEAKEWLNVNGVNLALEMKKVDSIEAQKNQPKF